MRRAGGGSQPCGNPSVSTKPGLIVCTRIPRRRSWTAVAREKAIYEQQMDGQVTTLEEATEAARHVLEQS